MQAQEALERGSIVQATDSYLLVEVGGYELFVAPRVERSGCACCADTAKLEVSYNRGDAAEADPLDIK